MSSLAHTVLIFGAFIVFHKYVYLEPPTVGIGAIGVLNLSIVILTIYSWRNKLSTFDDWIEEDEENF